MGGSGHRKDRDTWEIFSTIVMLYILIKILDSGVDICQS